ncbi:MAG TPA: helix-turn-helix transcriptional regulator [Actinomycetota bacterium]|jgi:transcriptional regulator with XRE-family HTH domain|nr:helix-turn-helix transcriptional regulator [Actinomycetota bacterium]
MEKPLKALGDFLRAQRALVHRSLRDVAEAAKISNAYLSQIERGIYKPSADVLRGLAEALEISKETLYRQAGMLDPSDAPEQRSTVEEAIKLDERLSDDQKDALLQVYRGFVSGS